MAVEQGPIYVDEKDVTAAGTPEALTTRDIRCSSVFLLPKSGNSGNMEVCDSLTSTKQITIPSTGITLPVNNPALITLDTTSNGDGVDWMAV